YLYLYINLSVLEAWEGHLEEALAAANEAVRLRPGYPRAYVFLGRVLAKLGRTDEARAAYGRAVYLAPRDGEAQAELARLADGADPDQALMNAGVHSLRTLNDPDEAAGAPGSTGAARVRPASSPRRSTPPGGGARRARCGRRCSRWPRGTMTRRRPRPRARDCRSGPSSDIRRFALGFWPRCGTVTEVA